MTDFIDQVVLGVVAAGDSWVHRKESGSTVYRYADFDDYLDTDDYLHQTVDAVDGTTGSIYAFTFPAGLPSNTFGTTLLVVTREGKRLAVGEYGITAPSTTKCTYNVATVKGERKEWPSYVSLYLTTTCALYT